MARRPRRVLPEHGWWHLTARAAGRDRLFRDREDCLTFLELLADATRVRRWNLHTLCLMGTHYHLLVETPEPDVSAGLQYLNGCYAQWFNRRHGRVGHLFGARFWAELVTSDERLVGVARYIVLNPVRAGLCADPADWAWSSHAATAGLRTQPLFLTVSRLLAYFSAGRERARERYLDWVEAGRREPRAARRAASTVGARDPGAPRSARGGRRRARTPAARVEAVARRPR